MSGYHRHCQAIRIEEVGMEQFHCIIQYIYSDHFVISTHSLAFFLQLFVSADFFMLPRLVDICSSYIKNYVNAKTAMTLLLYAMAHNASQLLRYCTHFIAKNRQEVERSASYQKFLRRAHSSLKDVVRKMIQTESQDCFLEIAIKNYQKRDSNKAPEEVLQEDLMVEELLEGSEYIYL